MRKFLSRTFVIAGMLALVACGGGGSGSAFENPPSGGNNPPPPGGTTVTQVEVLSSSPSVPSAGTATVDISAYVKDANNALVSGAAVTFATDSGQLQVTQATSDANGLARATLSPGSDPTSRRLTVTATSGTASAQVGVDVTGSQLTVQGPTAMVLGQSATFNLRLVNSAGAGIVGRPVTIASARSNTLSATTVTTDSSGNGTFTMTVTNASSDTLTASAMGLSTTAAVAVNSDSFSFTTPAANAEVALGNAQPVTVRWLSGGTPVVGQPVSFASTRGNVSAATAMTDGTGSASITVTSTNSGGALVTATGTGGATAQLPIEFVATSVASIELQPSVFTLSPLQESTLTATVRDAANNLVKNRTVTFSVQDITGGTLNTASAITDSQGRAQTTYKAGTSTSASGGVAVTATVQGTAIADTVNLTVAQAQLFISLGTGNNIRELANTTQYGLPYAVAVTDANGNGVANVPLSISVLSVAYRKGVRAAVNGFVAEVGYCADEDDNRNGVLDPNEDFNTNGRIEAGNIATVRALGATGLLTDADGFAEIEVVYPQEYAYYLDVVLDVRAGVSGTEFVRSAFIRLPGSAEDFNKPLPEWPGPSSPFGTVAGCISPN